MNILSAFGWLFGIRSTCVLLSAAVTLMVTVYSPATVAAVVCDNNPYHPKCDPPPEDDSPSVVDIAVKWTPPSGKTNYDRPCSPNSFGNNGGQYHCQHQDYRPPISFDFSGVYWDQTKKNGDDRLCAAMSGISIVADAMHQLYWEGACKGPGGCEIYTEVWFNGSDVQPAVERNVDTNATAVDFVRLKASKRLALASTDDANPYANDLSFAMDTAEVKFIKVGSNKAAAVCLYDWTVSGAVDPLVLETMVIPEPNLQRHQSIRSMKSGPENQPGPAWQCMAPK